MTYNESFQSEVRLQKIMRKYTLQNFRNIRITFWKEVLNKKKRLSTDYKDWRQSKS